MDNVALTIIPIVNLAYWELKFFQQFEFSLLFPPVHKEQIEKAEEKERLQKEKEEKERKEVEESNQEEIKTQEKSENHEEALKDDIHEKIGLLDNSPAIEVF